MWLVCSLVILSFSCWSVLCLCYFCFFKQKTAYEMRISDWSSDVCSSDLHAVKLWGRLDVVVNNVGDGSVGPMELVDADRIAAIFKVNVVYPSMVCAAALPHLEASEGLIVNMSSTYGSKAGAPLSYYAASKAEIGRAHV